MNEDGTLAKRIKILLLQEDEDFINLLSVYFKRKGAEVYIAGSAGHALELVRSIKPDFLFTGVWFINSWPSVWKEMKAAAPQMQVRFNEQAGNGKFFREAFK